MVQFVRSSQTAVHEVIDKFAMLFASASFYPIRIVSIGFFLSPIPFRSFTLPTAQRAASVGFFVLRLLACAM
jgi:hypothetical protein